MLRKLLVYLYAAWLIARELWYAEPGQCEGFTEWLENGWRNASSG